ncbi:endonuclease/exonuclease/phosphatase family protein [Listeria welshimeri]|nr:endonuclease/exonuclease/phosphatase family protein [Listeria welshimeri]
MSHIKWSILGLSEVRREGEDTITLDSGHLLYFREGDGASQGGVGFLVHKALAGNVVEVGSVSTRVAYLVVKLTDRYSLKVVQVYAPTSTHSDEEVEAMYEDITKAIHGTTSCFYNVVMGDFNAKVGVQECDESKIGPHGLGCRNHRGQMLVNFLEMQGLYLMNSFFKKKPQRRWTWQSPDTVTRNEIDFIMADKKYIFRDVSVINRFNTGSDHRLVRGTLNISFRAERLRLLRSTLRPTQPQVDRVSKQFQLELQNRFDSLETTGDVDRITENVVKTVCKLGRRHFPSTSTTKQSKLSPETLELMRQRREMPSAQAASPKQRDLSKRIRKLTRRDLRCSNTRAITTLIEQNRGSKVFQRPLGRSHLAKLKTADGTIVTSRPQIQNEVERF